MPDYDVTVIGGGPAGATAAISCSRLGLKTLLVERGALNRHKPCGGILPKICSNLLKETLGASVPMKVMSTPDNLGLYYVPPSGRGNGGKVRNYSLLHVNRDLLDQWLRDLAVKEGVDIRYNTSFLRFKEEEPIQVSLKGKEMEKMTTRYLIGADGVYSMVREQLFGAEDKIAYVFQEQLDAIGDFEECFYAFLRGDISPTYGYLIPKDGYIMIGVGVPRGDLVSSSSYLKRFKEWLIAEFAFHQQSIISREAWGIPYGYIRIGRDDVILIGDAAGFCNSFSGEGVRLAIESGVAAGNAIEENMRSDKRLATTYSEKVEPLIRFVQKTDALTTNMTDEKREEFVKSEISRVNLN
jgi:geranylgeranyl reductase family protein